MPRASSSAGQGETYKRYPAKGWSSGNKTGKTAAQKAKERKKANYRGAEGPKKSMPRAKKVTGRGTPAKKKK